VPVSRRGLAVQTSMKKRLLKQRRKAKKQRGSGKNKSGVFRTARWRSERAQRRPKGSSSPKVTPFGIRWEATTKGESLPRKGRGGKAETGETKTVIANRTRNSASPRTLRQHDEIQKIRRGEGLPARKEKEHNERILEKGNKPKGLRS